MDTELAIYKENKDSVPLVARYHSLIQNLSKLCKGSHREPDALFHWFYGLFLIGQPRSAMGLLETRDRIMLATSHLTREDCYNQILVFFLEKAKHYRSLRSVDSNFNEYIRMILGWHTKNWIDTLLTRSETSLLPLADETWIETTTQPFTIDLSWVLHGSLNPLFKELRAYERYLLYLHYTEDLTLVQIAEITYQSKNTVNSDINRALEKCRRFKEL